MGDASTDYLAEAPQHIAGIETHVDRPEDKRKLDQRHEACDREGAIRDLEEVGNYGLAQAMRDTARQPD